MMISKSKLLQFKTDYDIENLKKRTGYDLSECCHLIQTIGKNAKGDVVIKLKRKPSAR